MNKYKPINQKEFTSIILVIIVIALIGAGAYFVPTSVSPTKPTRIDTKAPIIQSVGFGCPKFPAGSAEVVNGVRVGPGIYGPIPTRPFDQDMVAIARKSLIKEGFSESFITTHLKVRQTEAFPYSYSPLWDGNVIWEMCVGDYNAKVEVFVNKKNGTGSMLSSANPGVTVGLHDLTNVIPQSKALSVFQSCMGTTTGLSREFNNSELNIEFRNGADVYPANDPKSKEGRLFLFGAVDTYVSPNILDHSKKAGEAASIGWNEGYVDLGTGQCTTKKGGVMYD